MDVCVVDVGADAASQRGDEVVFFGGPGAGVAGAGGVDRGDGHDGGASS